MPNSKRNEYTGGSRSGKGLKVNRNVDSSQQLVDTPHAVSNRSIVMTWVIHPPKTRRVGQSIPSIILRSLAHAVTPFPVQPGLRAQTPSRPKKKMRLIAPAELLMFLLHMSVCLPVRQRAR